MEISWENLYVDIRTQGYSGHTLLLESNSRSSG